MKVIILFLVLLFYLNPAFSNVSEYINEYTGNETYKHFSNIVKGSACISDVEKQLLIDREIQKELGTNFIYMDLDNCIKVALGENFDIKIQEENKQMSYWLNKNAQFSILPDVYYNFDIQDLGGEYLVGGIVSTTTHEVPIQSFLVAEWSTVNQGKYFFKNIMTRNTLKSQKANLEYTKEEIILNTILAYYSVLQKKLEIEVQKVNLYDRIEQLKYVQARFDAGIGTLYDVKRAQAELAQARQDYIETLYDLRINQSTLANVMGVDVEAAIYPFEISVDKRRLIDTNYDVDMLYSQALKSREDIRAKESEIKVYNAMRNMNYTDIIPDVSVSYRNGLVGTKRAGLGKNNSITLDVRMHLGQNMLAGTITQIKSDSAILAAKKLELKNLMRNIKQKIIDAYYASENALKKIEASIEETEAANISFDLSLASMKAGQATYIDVIESQNIKIRANINLIKNMIEYNKAQSRLLFESGLITKDSALKDYVKKFY